MKLLVFILASVTFVSSAVADNPPSQFDSIVKFFKENVQGNVLDLEAKGPSYDEKYTLTFKRKLTFGKLKVKDRALVIDLAGNIERTTVPISPESDEKELTEKTTMIRRLELAERLSTGKVVGFLRTLSEDGEKVYGEGDVILGDFDAEKNELRLLDSNFGYVDETLDGVTYHPISRTSQFVFRLDEKKNLVMDEKMLTHLVDGDTMAMELKSTHEFSSTQVLGLPRLYSK